MGSLPVKRTAGETTVEDECNATVCGPAASQPGDTPTFDDNVPFLDWSDQQRRF